MNYLMRLVTIIISTVIAVSAIFSFLLVGVNALLNAKIDPIKEKQAHFEIELKDIKISLININSKLDKLSEKK